MITVYEKPDKVSPAFNEMIFSISSEKQQEPDFKYIIDVTDREGNVIGTIKKPGNIGEAYRTAFDVSGLVSYLMFFDCWRANVQNDEYMYWDIRFRQMYNVRITEFYQGSAQDVTTFTDLYAIPAALKWQKFGLPYFTLWNRIEQVESGFWLTNFQQFRVRRNDRITCSFMTPAEGVNSFWYSFYNANNELMWSKEMINPYRSLEIDAIHLHCGFKDVIDFTGIPADLIEDVSHYYVSAGFDKNGPSRGLKFIVTCYHQKFIGVRMHFLNEWGGVDSFLFNLSDRRTVNVEKKKAKIVRENSDLRPRNYGFNNTPYRVTFTDSLKLTSGYISDNEANALQCLYTAPICNVEVDIRTWMPELIPDYAYALPLPQILPADVSSKSYEVKKSSYEKLHNIEIEVDIAIDNVRQIL